MNDPKSKTSKRIEVQGFVGLSDAEIAHLKYWLRLSPAICLTWIAIGVALASPTILLFLVPFALLGGIMKHHPFDVFYNHGIRYISGTPGLPENCMPRRFAFLMASGMIAGVAALFGFGLTTPAMIVGSVMVVMASIHVFTGICVPSYTFRRIYGTVNCGAVNTGRLETSFE